MSITLTLVENTGSYLEIFGWGWGLTYRVPKGKCEGEVPLTVQSRDINNKWILINVQFKVQ